jgi:hypothetical protein
MREPPEPQLSNAAAAEAITKATGVSISPADAFETERPDLDATDQQAADAIKVARTVTEGSGRVAALLTRRLPDRTRCYRPFDYLVAAHGGSVN